MCVIGHRRGPDEGQLNRHRRRRCTSSASSRAGWSARRRRVSKWPPRECAQARTAEPPLGARARQSRPKPSQRINGKKAQAMPLVPSTSGVHGEGERSRGVAPAHFGICPHACVADGGVGRPLSLPRHHLLRDCLRDVGGVRIRLCYSSAGRVESPKPERAARALRMTAFIFSALRARYRVATASAVWSRLAGGCFSPAMRKPSRSRLAASPALSLLSGIGRLLRPGAIVPRRPTT